MELTELRRLLDNAQSLEELIGLEAKIAPFFASDYSTAEAVLSPQKNSNTEMNAMPSSMLNAVQWSKLADDFSAVHRAIQELLALCEMCTKETEGFIEYSKTAQVVFASTENWDNKRKCVMERFTQLREKAGQFNLSPLLLEEEKLLLDVEKKGLVTLAKVKKYREDKEQDQPLLVKKDVLAQFDTLQQWTEKQVVNLEAVQEDTVDLQTFSYDVIASAGELMDTIDALFEKVHGASLDDPDVVKSLRQFGEMWFYLLDSLVDRLSFAMIETHDTLPLETLLSTCSETYFTALREFIQKVKHECSEKIDGTRTELSSVLSTAEGLKDYDKLLGSWRERYSLQKSAFNLFRNAGVSRLTYVPSEDIVLSVQRQHELDCVANELRSWGEEESRSESWMDIYNAIVDVKKRVTKMISGS